MKAVILAGGLGSRISEETILKPKPMIEIGDKPILWHIMKIYSYYGVNDFIICCGYKGYQIKEYFANYFLHQSNVTFSLKDNTVEIHKNNSEPWTVTLVDTGESSMTGGRLKRIEEYVRNDKSFCFTYGDGLSNVNIKQLIDFHNSHGKLATITSVYPPGRFGAMKVKNQKVLEFIEKPQGDGNKINGGFFVLSPEVISLIPDDNCIWEQGPLQKLAKDGNLISFDHSDFWHPMDTLRDKNYLEELWVAGQAPWKLW